MLRRCEQQSEVHEMTKMSARILRSKRETLLTPRCILCATNSKQA